METNNINNEQEKKKKKSLVAWFKGLKKSTRIVLCAALGVGVASAITFPVLSVTVWNNNGLTKIQVNKILENCYQSDAVMLVKDKKYCVIADLKQLQSYKTEPLGILIGDGYGSNVTKYGKDFIIKSNKNTFKCVTTENPSKHEYIIETGNPSNILVGEGSFSEEESECTFIFTAKENATVAIGFMFEN